MQIPVNPNAYGPAPVAPPAEFADRVKRLQNEMENSDLDLIVITAQENFDYFCSFRTAAWLYHARPPFLVVGRSETIVVASLADEASLKAADGPWETRVYEGFLPEAADTAVETCRALGGTTAKVGVDYGHELNGRGSLVLINGLADLGGVSEAGKLIWNVRAITSEFEMDLMRASFDIVNRAFDDVIPSVRVGVTELDVANALQIEFVKNGADNVGPFPVLFGKNDFSFHRPTSDRRLQHDDYLWTDFRSRYGGYPADRNRTARVGTPSQSERDSYTTVRQATVDLCRGIKAGMTCGDAYDLFAEVWTSAGLPQSWNVRSAGRVGHGGGIGLTEPPSIAAGNDEIIKPGMVLHLEPKLQTEQGVFQCEEIVHIGPEGNEFLSVLSPEELPIITP